MPAIKKGFKGFNKDLTCREFQFKEGESFEHKDEVKLCKSGFHFCENPLDCFNYYNPGESVFHAVEAEEVSNEKEEDSKRVAKKITIGSALSIAGMVEAAIKYISSKAKITKTGNASSDCRAHSATSDAHINSATSGNFAHSVTSGDYANSVTSGASSHSATSGNFAHSVTSGNFAHSVASGYKAHSTTSGKYANSVTFGDYTSSAAFGSYTCAAAHGAESVAIVTGYDSKACGALGCWLVLTERDEGLNIKCVKAVKVDGKKILPGVWYALKSRKIVQAV